MNACLEPVRVTGDRLPRRVAGLGLALWLGAGAAWAQQPIPPPPGAIYWLAGERSFDDRAGFHNGSGTGTSFITGQVGDGLHFDGIDDLVSVDVSSAEQRGVRDTFSYELWARPSATLPACAQSNNANCSGAGLRWAVFPSHGETDAPPGEGGMAAGIGIAIGSNAICVGEHSSFLVDCLARLDGLALNDWTHIAVVVQDKVPRIYINGVLAHTGVASAKTFVFASWVIVGSGLSLGAYAGDLDEVTLYRRALGDLEIADLFLAGADGKRKPECATTGLGATDDLWDVAHGTEATATSGLHASGGPEDFFAADTFGAVTPGSLEPGMAVFRDLAPDGTVHFLEWRTTTPIRLQGFRLHAAHDAAPQQRAFRAIRLLARAGAADAFVPIYSSEVDLPYALQTDPSLPGARHLKRCPNLRPMLAQEFRAEFTQDGSFPGGPRVIELDGIGLPDRIFRDGYESVP